MPNSTKYKILMIEDDIFWRKLYRDQIIKQGWEFIEAINGIEGINKALSDSPDLILLDLILPGKNGFDVLKELKEDQATSSIPVIVLTNLGQASDAEKALSLGAQNYLVKTEVRLIDVIEKIRGWVSATKK